VKREKASVKANASFTKSPYSLFDRPVLSVAPVVLQEHLMYSPLQCKFKGLKRGRAGAGLNLIESLENRFSTASADLLPNEWRIGTALSKVPLACDGSSTSTKCSHESIDVCYKRNGSINSEIIQRKDPLDFHAELFALDFGLCVPSSPEVDKVETSQQTGATAKPNIFQAVQKTLPQLCVHKKTRKHSILPLMVKYYFAFSLLFNC